MAQLNNLVITGSFLLGNTENTSSAGNIWYDTSTNQVKYSYSGLGAGAWSAGEALINTRQLLAGAGIQNAGLAFGGLPVQTSTFEYNGSSWFSSNNLITGRYALAGAGTQNAGLAFGGFSLGACTEEYNIVCTLTKTFDYSYTTGQLTSTNLNACGTLNSTGSVEFAYTYQANAWSAGGALITGRRELAGAGTQNAGLAFGGGFNSAPGILSCTEEYNGSSWSAGGALINGWRNHNVNFHL